MKKIIQFSMVMGFMGILVSTALVGATVQGMKRLCFGS